MKQEKEIRLDFLANFPQNHKANALLHSQNVPNPNTLDSSYLSSLSIILRILLHFLAKPTLIASTTQAVIFSRFFRFYTSIIFILFLALLFISKASMPLESATISRLFPQTNKALYRAFRHCQIKRILLFSYPLSIKIF